MQLRLDMDCNIHHYALSFLNNSNTNEKGPRVKLPGLSSCLVGECTVPFMRWPHESINTMLAEGMEEATYVRSNVLEYVDEIVFRPPTAACASSKVVLCARPTH